MPKIQGNESTVKAEAVKDECGQLVIIHYNDAPLREGERQHKPPEACGRRVS